MLNKLPPKVIVTISSHLTLQEKLAFVMLRRQLFNVISKTNLYSKLNLFKHTEKVEDIIGMFKGSRYPDSQVKSLLFDITRISDQLLVQLFTIFPNIIRVKTSQFGRLKVTFQDRHTQGPIR